MSRPTVNEIFRQYGRAYREKYPHANLTELKALRSIQICRTEELGGRVEECDQCGHRVVLYNSCRNRHCPQCQSMKKEQWIRDRTAEILPFSYFHIVFTVPDELNSIIRRNKRTLFNCMFRVCRETLLSVSADEKYLGADIGFFAILHTWGQKLNMHPHLHCVVPGGGFSQKRHTWIHAPYNYLVPVQVLRARFRSIFLTSMKKMYADGTLYLSGTRYEDPDVFQRLLDSLFRKEWVVYLKESFRNKSSVIEYLARYTHRIAISNHRIISVNNGMVSFSYRDYKDGNNEKVECIEATAFMRRFMLHIVPYRFVRIRYFGIISHRNKKKAIAACREFYAVDKLPECSSRDWRELFFIKTERDSRKCPECGTGRLFTKEIIPAIRYRAPPAVPFRNNAEYLRSIM
jgi:hypothetical protein